MMAIDQLKSDDSLDMALGVGANDTVSFNNTNPAVAEYARKVEAGEKVVDDDDIESDLDSDDETDDDHDDENEHADIESITTDGDDFADDEKAGWTLGAGGKIILALIVLTAIIATGYFVVRNDNSDDEGNYSSGGKNGNGDSVGENNTDEENLGMNDDFNGFGNFNTYDDPFSGTTGDSSWNSDNDENDESTLWNQKILGTSCTNKQMCRYLLQCGVFAGVLAVFGGAYECCASGACDCYANPWKYAFTPNRPNYDAMYPGCCYKFDDYDVETGSNDGKKTYDDAVGKFKNRASKSSCKCERGFPNFSSILLENLNAAICWSWQLPFCLPCLCWEHQDTLCGFATFFTNSKPVPYLTIKSGRYAYNVQRYSIFDYISFNTCGCVCRPHQIFPASAREWCCPMGDYNVIKALRGEETGNEKTRNKNVVKRTESEKETIVGGFCFTGFLECFGSQVDSEKYVKAHGYKFPEGEEEKKEYAYNSSLLGNFFCGYSYCCNFGKSNAREEYFMRGMVLDTEENKKSITSFRIKETITLANELPEESAEGEDEQEQSGGAVSGGAASEGAIVDKIAVPYGREEFYADSD